MVDRHFSRLAGSLGILRRFQPVLSDQDAAEDGVKTRLE
jgi:hypothetical protein